MLNWQENNCNPCDKQKVNGITNEIYQELLKLKKIKANHPIEK